MSLGRQEILRLAFYKHFFAYLFFIAIIIGACTFPSFASADYTDNEDAGEFGSGTNTNTQWDAVNTWLEMDATGLTAGSATFTSRIIDSTAAGTSWNVLSWVPTFPTGKALPDSDAIETAYSTGNLDMTSTTLLLHLDETSGNASDTSGSGITGAVTGATQGVDGMVGTAYSFDGGDYINLGDVLEDSIKGKFTVSAWVYVTGSDNTEPILAKYNSTSGKRQWMFRLLASKPTITIYQNLAGTIVRQYTTTNTVSLNAWHHLVFVGDINADTYAIYVDGYAAEGSKTNSAITTIADSNEPVLVGGSAQAGAFNGLIDELAVLGGINLTASDALNMYKRGALNMKFQARSCDDASCSGESFLGPASSTSQFFSELTTTTAGLPSFVVSDIVSTNRYFQYQTVFETVSSTISPELDSVTITTSGGGAPGFTVSAISGNTTEAGGTGTYTIVLNTEPAASVTVGVSSNDTTEGTVSTSSIYFDASNWSAPVTVTVTGVNDDVDDGDVAYTIVNAAAVSADGNYNDLNPNDVAVTNTDNDTAGVTVTESAGTTDVVEGGATDSYTVVLDSEPTAAVTVTVTPDADGTVSTSSIYFDSSNWNVAVTVTVTAVDDALAEGAHTTTINHTAASADGGYNAIVINSVVANVTDNDTAGFTVSAISGNTTEAGVTGTYTIVLNSEPTAGVTVGVSSSDTTEGTVSTSSIYFDSTNWSSAVTVTVTGVNDDVDDGDVAYSIVNAAAVSADGNYNNLNPADVNVTNTDNDTAGFTVSAISGNTTEAGGTGTYTIVLDSEPTAGVTVGVSSSDTTEGTVSTSSIYFDYTNWSSAVTVTVTGVNDSVDDGNVVYSIVNAAAVSADGNYNNLNPNDVAVTNTDNDTAGVTVTESGGTTDVVEGGATDSYTVVLDTEPTAAVTVSVTPDADGTVSTSSIYFDSSNWNVAVTVTVTAVNDALVEGAHTTTIDHTAASADGSYNAIVINSVVANVTDNDAAGFTVSAISGNTTEAGGSGTYTIVLDTSPAASVTVGVSSSDTTEGTVSTSSIFFDSSNWNVPVTVTVTGVNDAIDDGDIAYSIVNAAAVSADGNYNNLNPADVNVTNTDNDTAGFTVSAISGNTAEAGGTGTYTIVLDSEPTAGVTVGVSSSDTTEGTVSTSSIYFDSTNWSSAVTVTVTGVNDDVDDGDIAYSIVNAAAVSADGSYNNLNPADVNVTNTDNDVAGFTVSAISGNTTEAGGTGTYTIVLNTEPTAGVTVGVSSSDTTEGTVSTSSIYFDSTNWSSSVTVTVTGVNDNVDDGNIAYSIVNAAAVSADGNYNNVNPADVNVTNTDNDTVGVTVAESAGTTNVVEGGATDSYTIVLDSEPTAAVTISVTPDADGTVSTSSIYFDSSNWNVAVTVTVTAVNDALVEGGHTTTIDHTAASGDGSYNAIVINSVVANITDDDAAGFTVSAISGNTTEAGGTGTYTIVLNTQPAASVTVGVSSSDTTEGTVSTSSIHFDSTNWSSAVTVTVTGVDDSLDDGDVAYTILNAAAVSADGNYNNLNPNDVAVTNTDNDVAGFTVSAISGNTTEAGGTGTYTIVLNSEPTASVTVGVLSSDLTEGTVSTSSIYFDSTNWSSAVTVTVTGVDDDVEDGNIAYTVANAAAVSADGSYNNVNPNDVVVTNTDNETAGVTVTESGGTTVITEDGATDSYTIVLNSEPTAAVTVTVTPDADGTVSTSSISFDSSNWNVAVTVTVTAVDDADVEGAHTTTIAHTAVSGDGSYDAILIGSVTASITDNDAAAAPAESANSASGVAPAPVVVIGTGSSNTGSSINSAAVINRGAVSTLSRRVILNFNVENVSDVAISNSKNFPKATFVPYKKKMSWKLPAGKGTKTVYIRFRSPQGAVLDVTDTITFGRRITTPSPRPQPVPIVTPAPALTPVPPPAPAYNFTQFLSRGSVGEEVRQLQNRLQILGFYTYPAITGLYGPVTEESVRSFQRARGIDPLGYVGPATREALNKR